MVDQRRAMSEFEYLGWKLQNIQDGTGNRERINNVFAQCSPARARLYADRHRCQEKSKIPLNFMLLASWLDDENRGEKAKR